jgi:copper oxidase (laccase) domain-containing protein
MQVSSSTATSALEFFPSLSRIQFVRHGFIGRIPGIDVATDRASALVRLDARHRSLRAELNLARAPLATAEQVHGDRIVTVDQPLRSDHEFAGTDALVTNQSGVSLGIYVADCCAVFLIDPIRRAIGLAHSGRKGTELKIVRRTIETMRDRFGTSPAELIVQLSPCIRPPHYEVDFAAEIVRQARTAGVVEVHDCGVCTACDLSRYYSYRAEKARTGRMLALLALNAGLSH